MITPLIITFVVLTVALIAFAVAPRMVKRTVVFAGTPDQPKPFGYGMSWLALKTTDTAAVISCLELTDTKPANWNSGIGTIYDSKLRDGYVFISPPVKGWTLVAGVPLPQPVGRSFIDKLSPMLTVLSQRFTDVQYFAAFPIIDYFGWARLQRGKLVRVFVIGDDGVISNRGRLTQEERALGLKLYDLRGIKDRKGDAGGAIVLYPTEEQVVRLARAWSLDPIGLDKLKVEPGTGVIARAPSSWRAERIKKQAA